MKDISRRGLLRLASLSPVVLTARAVAAHDPVLPPQTCPAPPLMATVGVAAGQALRVSLFHHADPAGAVNPCLFKIEVLGLGGELLGFYEGQIFPGKGAYADFDVAKGLWKGQRVQVHINVTVPADHPVGATAEVFDLKTGEMRYPVNPCAEPGPFVLAMGTVGVVADQVVRLSLFHHLDPQGIVTPCLFKFQLIGIDGSLLGANSGKILPGQGAAFDFNLPGLVGLKQGERLQFHADVWVEHPSEVGSLIEIIDVKTGETSSSVTPCLLPLPPA